MLSARYDWQKGAGHLHFGDSPRLLIHLGSDFSKLTEQDQFVLFVGFLHSAGNPR